MQEYCEWWMKHLPVFLGALCKHFRHGLLSKEVSVKEGKDKEGKHSKTKYAEKGLFLGRRKVALYCFYLHRKCPERPERCLYIYIYIYVCVCVCQQHGGREVGT